MKIEFPRSGIRTPLPRLGLKANVLMYFVNLTRVFSFLIKPENTLSLTLEETLCCVNFKK